jgi:Ca2+:H+ antiporter
VARRLLWASLGLAPVTMIIRFATDAGDVTLFVLAAASLVPLAWLIGEATEHAARHTGPGVGGFVNATFGNAPELIIALFAVNDGLFEVVRGSLTGSVVGNLLLVLGFSLLVGPTKEVDRASGLISVGLVLFSVLLFLVTAVPSWHGDTERHALHILSIPVSVALLIVYVAVTWWQLRRHRALFAPVGPDALAWPLGITFAVLSVATVATAVVAEILVGSIETFAEKAHLSDFFVAAVIVAIVGNAAEHGGAVIVARRGRVKLATEIALSSSAQVAVFLIPAVAILSWAIKPL